MKINMVQATETPKLSIIVPVKNMARTVRDTVESLLELDYPEDKLEIIFVDGRSTDETLEIISQYPVKLIEQEGKGLNGARNTGIKYSNGDIIAYTDGDCVVPQNWAKRIALNFTDQNVGFVGGTMEGYDKRNPLSNYMDETFFQVTPGFRVRIETTELELMQFPAGANMAFRRSALARIQFFDENINYGFDDLQPVEEMGFKGFRIVLDPRVRVRHQHRTTLAGLLKQHFNYGRGGTLLFVNKRASILAHWFSTFLIFSVAFLSVFLFLVYLGLKIDHPLPINLASGSFGLFYAVFSIYYIPVSIKSRKFWKIILYPPLDILRGLAFTFGGVYQLFKSLSRKVIMK
ncbi:glycosyltransferase [Candidatus Bathyarchaeota archaeon]|nr:glycosyltransferase [Candidatus Bathyarchaeota archaeon]